MRALAAALAAAATLAGCGGETVAAGASLERPLELERDRKGRERPPYMGVSCAAPNSVGCDRIGLAVWLERPAERMTATIAGRRLELRSPGEFVTGRGTGWEGYLQPAGLGKPPFEVVTRAGSWEGDPPVTVPVELRAEYANGSTRTRTLRLLLHPGWG